MGIWDVMFHTQLIFAHNLPPHPPKQKILDETLTLTAIIIFDALIFFCTAENHQFYRFKEDGLETRLVNQSFLGAAISFQLQVQFSAISGEATVI